MNLTEVLVSDLKNAFSRNFQLHRRDPITDRPPFGGLGSGRRGMLPDPIREVQPMFFLSNILGSDMLVDWENPSLSRFETNKPVVVTSHGWYAKDWWQLEATEKFNQLQNTNYIRFIKFLIDLARRQQSARRDLLICFI